MTTTATPGRDAFRGECLSLAAQLELYAKIDGILPGIVAAMQESAAALRLAAKPSDEGVRELKQRIHNLRVTLSSVVTLERRLKAPDTTTPSSNGAEGAAPPFNLADRLAEHPEDKAGGVGFLPDALERARGYWETLIDLRNSFVEVCRSTDMRSGSNDPYANRIANEAIKRIDAILSLPSAPVSQIELRKLVDVVWNEATESTAVPSTDWADRMIARAFPPIAAEVKS